MMLILTDADLAKMQPELRRELQKFLLSRLNESEHDVSFEGYDVDDLPSFLESPTLADSESSNAKQVIDISDSQAQELIGNLSEKSISTLRLFAGQVAVPLDNLLGEGKAYANFTDLKRSFVGAVNRRLRTVTRNRTAVLFRKTALDDLGGLEGIAVRPRTAAALAAVFLEKDDKISIPE